MKQSKEHPTFEFTEDMVETALTYFANFQEDGVLKIQRNYQGLWLVSSEHRAFLGLARLPRLARDRKL